MFKTKNCDPEMLNIFYRNFVRPIKIRFDHNLNFINRCLDEFFRMQDSPLRETKFCVSEVKNLKNKLDKLEKIDLPRFLSQFRKLEDGQEIEGLRSKFKVKDLKDLDKLKFLFKEFPEYKERHLEYRVVSRVFDKMDYAKTFLDGKSKRA